MILQSDLSHLKYKDYPISINTSPTSTPLTTSGQASTNSLVMPHPSLHMIMFLNRVFMTKSFFSSLSKRLSPHGHLTFIQHARNPKRSSLCREYTSHSRIRVTLISGQINISSDAGCGIRSCSWTGCMKVGSLANVSEVGLKSHLL